MAEKDKDKDKDFYRYMPKDIQERTAVYDPESPYFKMRKKQEQKYLDSAQDSEDRVRKLKVISEMTDPNVPQEKAKYRRGHIATNEALYGMKKGGKVSSASSRADGCAQRGKTRGKMV